MKRFDLSQVHSNYHDSFVTEVAQIFAPSLPLIPALCGPDQTRAFFHLAVEASKAAGFELRGEIVTYTFLALHLGLFFETDPLYHDIRADMLWKHAGAHPNVGLNRMFRSTDLMIAEGLCAAKDGVAPGFGAACHQAGDLGDRAPLSAAFELCATANHRRFQALGASRVHAALSLAQQDPRLSGHHATFIRDWLICTHYLGHGFERNPLFSWVPEALMRGDLPKIGSRLDG